LEESDCAIVPMKLTNNEDKTSAEPAEGRAQAKENDVQPHTHPTQSGARVSQGLDGVRQKARGNKQERFTALLHHLTVDLLRESFYALKRHAAAGVDGISWQQYEHGLEARLVELHGQVHRGAYRAQASRRVYIPKADGRQRPLGVTSLEDKIVQQAITTILNQIYEVDFRGFSYGFRPRLVPGTCSGDRRNNHHWKCCETGKGWTNGAPDFVSILESSFGLVGGITPFDSRRTLF
jgi:RNA-directed DNA polymerase